MNTNSAEYSAIVQCEESLKSTLSTNPALAAWCIAQKANFLTDPQQMNANDTTLSTYTRACNLVEAVKERVRYSDNPRYLFDELLKALKNCGAWTDNVIRLLRTSLASRYKQISFDCLFCHLSNFFHCNIDLPVTFLSLNQPSLITTMFQMGKSNWSHRKSYVACEL